MLFYDGINPEDVRDLVDKGLISGLTTNLTLVSQARKSKNLTNERVLEEYVNSISSYNLPLSIQVESNSPQEIITEALGLRDKFGNLVDLYIKIPVNFNNLYSIKYLTNNGVKINATCVTSFMQGKLCTLSGAKIVSFFWGKMYDQGQDPSRHVNSFKLWVQKEDLIHAPTLLVGSVRQIGSIEAAFLSGADVVTTSKENIEKLANQLTSDNANEFFQKSL